MAQHCSLGKQGETCAQYLAKGRQVYIEGSIRNRSYDDKSGNKRYITEIVAQRVRFLGGGGGARLAPEVEGQAHEEPSVSGESQPIDDDIPFGSPLVIESGSSGFLCHA